MRWAIVLFGMIGFAHGQTQRDVNLEKLMDEIFPVQDGDLNYEELYETYAQLLAHPLNLNTVTEQQLQSLLLLSDKQLLDFFQYRNEMGPLLSYYELQSIPSFTDNIIRLLQPFVEVREEGQHTWKGLGKRAINTRNKYWVTRLEHTVQDRAGYSNEASPSNRYAGNPQKLYNRIRATVPGDFSFGLTSEQDAGEQWQWNARKRQYGFDFISAHAQVMNKGRIENLIAGDFQAQFGQGLTLGGGFGMGKGSETITTIRRSNLGFLPYTSALESGYFRGAAISVKLQEKIRLHSFVSTVFRDGRTDTTEAGESLSSLYYSGLHRTDNEILGRKTFRENNFGCVLQLKSGAFDAGIIWHYSQFELPLIRPTSPYNQFAFQGNSNTNTGIYLNYAWRNFSLFGEASHSLGAGQAATIGLLTSLSASFETSWLFRTFSKDFYSFYSNAFAESTAPQNETGLYWGWKYQIASKHRVQGYIDLFRFPWLKFNSYQPSSGNEWLARYTYTPAKHTLLFAQVRVEEKVQNISGDTRFYQTGKSIRTNYWFNADYTITSWLSMKTRVQLAQHDKNAVNTKGTAVIQDVSINWRRLTFNGRMALFHTDNYETRLYLYERDAWLAFSIPALQGIGTRRYWLLQYKATENIDVWFRWATTEYEDRDSIGSNGEKIEGNKRTDLKFQVRIKF